MGVFRVSEREQLERTKLVVKKEIQNLEKDGGLISKKTSALAILYKKQCLVDKSKSDAVKIYLNYEIELAKAEHRKDHAELLEKELIKK